MRFVVLATEVITCILVFGVIHFLLMRVDVDAYHIRRAPERALAPPTVHGQLLEAVYFSLVTQSTVGYGSIVPHAWFAKAVTSVQILTTLLFVIRWTTIRY